MSLGVRWFVGLVGQQPGPHQPRLARERAEEAGGGNKAHESCPHPHRQAGAKPCQSFCLDVGISHSDSTAT